MLENRNGAMFTGLSMNIPTNSPLQKKTSTKPLSMKEVIQILDTSKEVLYDSGEEIEYVGLIKPVIEYMKQDGCKKEESIDFVTVESAFYPELFAYYEQRKEIWFDEA